MKKLIQKIFNKIGFKIMKTSTMDFKTDLDYVIKKLLNLKNPIIFDVGANDGKSITRFKKIFSDLTIHAFEPQKKLYLECKKLSGKNIHVNNFALGKTEENLVFNKYAQEGLSSFHEYNEKPYWSKKDKFSKNGKMIIDKFLAKIVSLDKYCRDHKIDNIDLLKIDTQGYEEEILEGSKNLIKSNNIKVIEVELIFSDLYKKNIKFI